jgi:hypothetical protein
MHGIGALLLFTQGVNAQSADNGRFDETFRKYSKRFFSAAFDIRRAARAAHGAGMHAFAWKSIERIAAACQTLAMARDHLVTCGRSSYSTRRWKG